MQEILVPVDGSEGANRAAHFAARLASETGAVMTLLYVYDAPTANVLGLASLTKEAAREAIARVAEGSFERARAAAEAVNVRVETHVAMGHPANEIVARAREYQPQLIVMGSRGLSPLEGALLGSVSEYVLRHAPCPVTVHR